MQEVAGSIPAGSTISSIEMFAVQFETSFVPIV